ncbi:short-chain fatty acyl-CoA regulator family protein [Janthinobacterium agaricidamnosum]|uniref:Helix-turn-helix family protein n=1 Tax=Janthinobacterium agaricidamnosum NBRC 102515 = DSM 9628 TaxID=1349767 RepID=W0UZJ1_9BURK|nr:short-chain fatty acyl-CoA regulator family protein [Janthinobacterium agaricidamnosum]CDG81046.1 helix-turn-helix family protein [Janthinobacterium agaricidamnosum NBRC 102515 = DSM 9628]
MAKVFMGVRLQRLREERRMTQVALAKALDISPSYLNQMERNQRPLTVPILLRIGSVLGVDPQIFSEHDSAGLVADVRDVFGELPDAEPTSMAELKMLVENMPSLARSILLLHRRYRAMAERADTLAARLDDGGRGTDWMTPSTDEEVREYLNRRQNYIDQLDQAAEQVAQACDGAEALQLRLATVHGVTVQNTDSDAGMTRKHRYHAAQKILWLPDTLTAGQRAFQMAALISLLEQAALIDALVQAANLSGDAARGSARLAFSNYFAGALLMPYQRFLQAAENCAYDIERLAHQFGVGFEAVCHRLSTMQRPGAAGLPFFFVRVDRAGNVSKRQSATDFHFSRVGGTCPLWIVYEAFNHPTRVLTQVARMPDGCTYLWVARQVSTAPAGFRAPGKTFAVALGCDISQAHRLVYSKGLDLQDPSAATPIGTGCKVCERPACPQRAFPSLLLLGEQAQS